MPRHRLLLVLMFCNWYFDKTASIGLGGKNLKYFVKLTSSLNPEDVTLNYINGTIYSIVPGQRSFKLFYFEGYNIARKSALSTGDYESYSCEFVVYRDPVSRRILYTWFNPFTSSPNEVFPVHNYPVNALLTRRSVPRVKTLTSDLMVFNTDVLLRYPNPLPPETYPRYSAGPFYVGAEFFEYFGRKHELKDSGVKSANLSSTWNRISQWLPWMEMGTFDGHLLYSSFSWKIPTFSDFPEDILELVQGKYPKFLKPPKKFDIPNETTWGVFKRIITERRKSGLPDIILHPDTITPSNPKPWPCLDPRVKKYLLQQSKFSGILSGQVYSFTDDHDSFDLFQVKGHFAATIRKSGRNFKVQIDAEGEYIDAVSGKILVKWLNPITGEELLVPKIEMSKSIKVLEEDMLSIPLPPSDEIGISAVTSNSGLKNWHTSSLLLVISEHILSENERTVPKFYGTYSYISSWLHWMNMKAKPGYLAFRVNVLPNEGNT